MNLPGYVNPREIGNSEPNEMFRMDIFIEDSLWNKYISYPNVREQSARTFDVCSMLLHTHHGEHGGRAIEAGQAFYQVEFVTQEGKGESDKNFANDTAYDKTEVVTLRAYQHPEVMALCVGLAHNDIALPTHTPKFTVTRSMEYEKVEFDVGGWVTKKHLTMAKVGIARLPKGCKYIGTVTCEHDKEPVFKGIDPKLNAIVLSYFLRTVPLADRTPQLVQPVRNNRDAIAEFLEAHPLR
jgi:hypothetical protein